MFEVAGNTELSQDKPRACIAMERICIAPSWEVMLYVFMYIQSNMTEQTLLKVFTDVCLRVRESTATGLIVQKVRKGGGGGLHTASCSPLFVMDLGPTPSTHQSPEMCQTSCCKV